MDTYHNNSRKSWYGFKDVEEYFMFISKHPILFSNIFKKEPKAISEKRKLLSDRYYDFSKKNVKKILDELIPTLLKRAEYISFSILTSDKTLRSQINELLEEEKVRDGVYRNTEIISKIAIMEYMLNSSNDYWTEDHILLDENYEPFFKSITHECMFYIKSSPDELIEIKENTGIEFDLALDDEPII